MASRATIDIIELHLQEFCEACLELISGQSGRGSILADVLPSFARVASSFGRAAAPLSKELNAWKQKSLQLARLAALHCGDDSDVLIASLDKISHEATRVIEALSNLTSRSECDVIVLADVADAPLTLSTATAQTSGGETVDFHLKQFCESVLVLMHSGPDNSSVIPQTMPSIYNVFSACGSSAHVRLRTELHESRTTAEGLIHFADVHCTKAVIQLQQRVRQAQESAERLIGALESLAWSASSVGQENRPTLLPNAGDGPSNVGRDQAQRFYHLAIESHQQQDFQHAESLYSEALRLDAALREAWVQRGLIRVLNGNANRAITDLTHALTLFPEDSIALRWRGDALSICERFEEALKDYDHSLQIHPGNFTVRYNRAVVLRTLGKLELAWSEFEQLLKLNSNVPGAHLNCGLICLARGEEKRAIQEFRSALVVRPGLAEAVERLRQLGVNVESEIASNDHEVGSIVTDSPPSTTAVLARPKPAASKFRQAAGSRRNDARILRDVSVSSETVSTDVAQTLEQATHQHPEFDELAAAAVLLEPIPKPEMPASRRIRITQSTETSSTETADSAVTTADVPASMRGTAPIVSTAAETASAVVATLANQMPSRTSTLQTSRARVEIRCPECDGLSSIRWDRLQEGNTVTCRRCSCHFVVQQGGVLVRVVKNRRGKWKELLNDRFTVWKDPRVLAAITAVAVLAAMVIFRTDPNHYVVREDPGYPQELEPRAKLFALAWLKGDFRTMRQLTDGLQAPELHLWAMDHPVPTVVSPATLERDATFNVEIVDANPPNAKVQVRIEGLRVMQGHSLSNLAQNWKQEGSRWIFQPVSRSNL